MDNNELSKVLHNVLLESVNKIVENKLKNLLFNYCVEGQIKQINKNNTYVVLINGEEQVVYVMNNDTYNRGDIVYILVINNNYSNKYILCKKSTIIV